MGKNDRQREGILKAIDLFCGAGGLTRGLLDAGIDVVAGIDIDPCVGQTYEANNSPSRFFQRDVRQIDPCELLEIGAVRDKAGLILAGCAPCRAFSKHQRNGRSSGPDATLLTAFGKVVAAIRPGWVLVENVPGLAQVQGYSTHRRFLGLLVSLGYRISQGVLNACHHGVPQYRRRYVMLACRKAVPSLPEPRFGPGRKPFETVRRWIAHYPELEAGEAHPAVPNHVASSLSEMNLVRLRATPKDGGDRTAWPPALELPCHRGRSSSFSDAYGRMWWNRFASTLTGRCNSLSNGRFGHPEQHRAISLREAASLQTFPDHYVFYGPHSHVARHIGNAVPVLLAEALGRQVLATHTSC